MFRCIRNDAEIASDETKLASASYEGYSGRIEEVNIASLYKPILEDSEWEWEEGVIARYF